MNSYTDIGTNEEFTEDITIREALDRIDNLLAAMTKEERIQYFASFSKPPDTDFCREIGGVCYAVSSHFSNDGNENIQRKVGRLLSAEMI